MIPNPSTISRVSSCLAIIAAAAVGACGGAERTPNALLASQSATPLASSRAVVPTPSPAAFASAPILTATMTATTPAVDTAKIPTGAVGYASDLLRPTTDQPNAADIGAFRTVCEFSHMAFDDPIVYPGQPGRSHLHAFFGNTGVDGNSTAESIAATGNSTCRGGTVNRTAYWSPAVIDTRDGTPVKPDFLLVYYKTGYRGIAPQTVQPIPPGLRMIAGDSTASAPTPGENAIFACTDPNTGQGPRTAELPSACPVGHKITAGVMFPQCWDGVHLDSPDHKSHMAYPSNGRCPASHPVPFPEIALGFAYTVTDAAAVAHWRLASDNYDSNIPGGYSLHADWFNGWKPEAMQSFIRNCDQASRDCSAHLLGNGQMMLGVGVF